MNNGSWELPISGAANFLLSDFSRKILSDLVSIPAEEELFITSSSRIRKWDEILHFYNICWNPGIGFSWQPSETISLKKSIFWKIWIYEIEAELLWEWISISLPRTLVWWCLGRAGCHMCAHTHICLSFKFLTSLVTGPAVFFSKWCQDELFLYYTVNSCVLLTYIFYTKETLQKLTNPWKSLLQRIFN